MTRLEERLADALEARAKAVDHRSVRPLPQAGELVRGHWAGSGSRRWLAPAAAAISLVLVATVATVVSRHGPGAGQEPISSQRATFRGELDHVEALSATNVWAVGSIYTHPTTIYYNSREPVIMHWDGRSWRRVAAPRRAAGGELMSIAGGSPNDLWAVGGWLGDRPQTGSSLIAHWNGKSWRLVRSRPAGSGDGELLDVSARTSTDVWAVGAAKKGALILHWNGRSWNRLPAPQAGAGLELYGVTALSSRDAWAVGGDNNGEVVMHWNGTRWRLVRTPSAGPGPAGLATVTALSAREVWAAGTVADGIGLQVIRWDGRTWQLMPDRGFPSFGQGFDAVAATSPDDLWAVGRAGRFTPGTLIMHWNGLSWSRTTSPELNLQGTLMGLSARSPNDVWAVGLHDSDDPHSERPLILHWDGTSWTMVLR
ncbi:MAG TPA: hypothetical protein VFI65_26220 [Streptosporangiaceae bacterium]|nr:hypothetical protein [Streptosporangiaceae bacterium]